MGDSHTTAAERAKFADDDARRKERDERRRTFDLWLEAAYRYLEAKNETPVVLDVELYEHFGQPCKIVDVRVYRGGVECVIEGRFAERVTVDSSQLALRPRPEAIA